MKYKKPLVTTVLGLSILCFGTSASAEQSVKLIDSDTTLSNKQAKSGMISIMASPTNTSNTKVYTQFLGDPYSVSSSSSTTKEDYIYAKSRTFNSDGGLISSKSSSAENSTYASAKAVNGTIVYGNDWAIGNHTYKLSGYNDVIHETQASW
jgi:hypothetical protein